VFTFGFRSEVESSFVLGIVKKRLGEKRMSILMKDLIDDSRKKLDMNLYRHLSISIVGPSSYFVLYSRLSALQKHAYQIIAIQETMERIEYSDF
jgi:hypothetical protein